MTSIHSNRTQEQRYWVHSEKFDGLNGNFLAFVYELSKEIGWYKEKSKEGTRVWKIQDRALKYLQLIYNYGLASAKEIDDSPRIRKYREAIRFIPLPKSADSVDIEDRTERRRTINEEGQPIQIEIVHDSDIEEPALHARPGTWPKGWIANKDEREVGQYLLKMVESAITGSAKDVVTQMGCPKDRNGFMALSRLAEVYGRNAAHIAMMPQLFHWGDRSLPEDWNAYKNLLDSAQYATLHSSNHGIMVHSALNGFQNYHHYHRLTDYIRVTVGDNAPWEKFKKCVDDFIGDTHRIQFQESMCKNENNVAIMSAAGISEKANNVCAIRSTFRPLKKTEPKGPQPFSKGNKKTDNRSNFNTVSTTASSDALASPKAQKKQNKKGKGNPAPEQKKGVKQCAWCGDTSHKHFQCKTHGNGKWDGKKCNRCNGVGHPPEVCSTPSKKK